ncbi:ribosomal RNA-processing protein 17, partial [Tremellales sp. Uapishka_1]
MAPVAKSNVALLTEGQSYIRRAQKARQDQVEDIKFDDEARREWLTGFSKRKKEKHDNKKKNAKERDRLAHLEERRKARNELKERAAQNVRDVRRAMGLEDVEVEAGPSTQPEDLEAEYSDTDHQATVTITENFDPASVTQAFARDSDSEPEGEEEESSSKPKPMLQALPPSSRKVQKQLLRDKEKTKKKTEKVKSLSMETKAERKRGREIEGKRRREKGALAMERDGKTRGSR